MDESQFFLKKVSKQVDHSTCQSEHFNMTWRFSTELSLRLPVPLGRYIWEIKRLNQR